MAVAVEGAAEVIPAGADSGRDGYIIGHLEEFAACFAAVRDILREGVPVGGALDQIGHSGSAAALEGERDAPRLGCKDDVLRRTERFVIGFDDLDIVSVGFAVPGGDIQRAFVALQLDAGDAVLDHQPAAVGDRAAQGRNGLDIAGTDGQHEVSISCALFAHQGEVAVEDQAVSGEENKISIGRRHVIFALDSDLAY